MPRPSQKLIAQRLGISTASVSLALRRKGTVSSQLIEKVHAVAKELDYQPNPILSSLASKRFRSSNSNEGTPIAILNFLREGVGAGNLYFDSISEFARELGYHCTQYSEKELLRYNNPSATLYSRGVQGLIILGLLERPAVLEKMNWSQFSVVQCCRFLVNLPFHTARSDISQSLKESFKQVCKFGYKRIGFAPAHHNPIVEDDEARISAAYGILNLHIAKENRIPPYLGGIDDVEDFLDWVKRYEPEVVIGFNHKYGVALVNAGYRIPDEIGYVSLHVAPGVPIFYDHPQRLRISGLNQNIGEIAKECVTMLDQNIHYHNLGIPRLQTNILVSSTWIQGETLRQVGNPIEPDTSYMEAIIE